MSSMEKRLLWHKILVMMPLLFLVSLLASCRSGLIPVSKRNLGVVPSGKKMDRKRAVSVPAKAPDIFIRQKKTVIKPKKAALVGGSLYAISDERNILIGDKPRGMLGSYLDLKVDSSRLDNKENEAPEAAPAAPDSSDDDLEKTLLAALPDLNSGEDNPVLLKNLKMRVGGHLDNGDALVSFVRSSTNGAESKAINVLARIPFKALNDKRALTTKDLYDVEWIESSEGEYFERKSTIWEDEYTLRLSGFTEAKSKAAVALQEKKKQLKKVNKQMSAQLQNMASQRVKIAQERGRLKDIRLKHKEEKKVLTDQLDVKDDKIAEKEEAIKTVEQEKKEMQKELREAKKALREAEAAAIVAAEEAAAAIEEAAAAAEEEAAGE